MGDLPPGRELDAHAARVVMGWVPIRYGLRDCMQRPDGAIVRLGNWKPSTDTAAAFELVDKLKAKGFMVNILIGSHGNANCVTVFRSPVAAPFSVAEATFRLSYFRMNPMDETESLAVQAGGLPEKATLAHAITLAACKAAEARGDG